VIGEDKQMDGKAWKNVKDEEGTAGWMASELLEPA
jgi:SH3-like domain-containing protein